ncbi:M18 family aminopeptidase [Desulfonema ishimotonii]|uniref:M18 family aminopeptidase n=1 Tax=Desulfonema ishimotonii TaxID=45657 RepID=A0A401FXP1_9BACT|nr:M18 family aminopeptidase [Desulfonema ishimotonii]GBC61709.1 M18 family aminopeptidase [Desulfonema ishimotonii]
MKESQFNRGMLNFLKKSPTPFHAVLNMSAILDKAGFQRLSESDAWALKKEGRYYVTRNGSSVIAFTTGQADFPETGIRMAGAHTDSPCLKVKPLPEKVSHSYLQIGVEVYGGALLNPWFDRDLSLAGRVTWLTSEETVESALVDFESPVAVIPSLAIHFDREANKNKSVNPQDELPPILLQVEDNDEALFFRDILADRLRAEHPEADVAEILGYEISLYDTQPPAQTGMNREFITGARLDNLMSCHTGLMALIGASGDLPCLLVCNDHEEVGSASVSGAQGPFLEAVLSRLCPKAEDRLRAIDRSLMISADDAHGVHPNYAAKSDPGHGPLLNHGPVIKINASQRYASDSETVAAFRHLCRRADVPVQDFVMRSDLACGSTIGPLTATRIGVKTVDVGVPIFAMHSVREMAGSRDGFYLFRALGQHYA